MSKHRRPRKCKPVSDRERWACLIEQAVTSSETMEIEVAKMLGLIASDIRGHATDRGFAGRSSALDCQRAINGKGPVLRADGSRP